MTKAQLKQIIREEYVKIKNEKSKKQLNEGVSIEAINALMMTLLVVTPILWAFGKLLYGIAGAAKDQAVKLINDFKTKYYQKIVSVAGKEQTEAAFQEVEALAVENSVNESGDTNTLKQLAAKAEELSKQGKKPAVAQTAEALIRRVVKEELRKIKNARK